MNPYHSATDQSSSISFYGQIPHLEAGHVSSLTPVSYRCLTKDDETIGRESQRCGSPNNQRSFFNGALRAVGLNRINERISLRGTTGHIIDMS